MTSIISRIAKKVAQKYIEQNHTQQPLRLQPDYNERNAQDFLGETEGFEIIDDLDRMGELLKESRLPSHKHNDKKTVEKAWEEHKKNNPDMEKYEGAMTPDGLDESKVEENSSKLADDEIIDDMGLGRMAGDQQIGSGSNGYIAMWNREKVEVYADSKFEAQEMAQAHFQKGTRKRIKGYDVTVMLAEKGGSQVTHRPMFASDRMAEDHDRGSYMSRQNLREMSDMADFIVDDIGSEGLDDWVEDKVSQAYAAISDVARYRGYRDDHPHGEDGFSDKFANDDIIDDLEW